MSLHVKYAIYTHTGLVRSSNEDTIEAGSIDKLDSSGNALMLHYMIVCDGMGGMKAGETASKLAVSTIIDYIKAMPFWPTLEDDIATQLRDSVSAAHQNIMMLSNHDFEKNGMGTTLVFLIILKNKAFVIWSGDSRAYFLTQRTHLQLGIYQDGIYLVTRDHATTWTNIASGILTLDQARNHPQANMLTQSLGGSTPPIPEIEIFDIFDGDRLMLCTDGVNLHLDTHQIATCLEKGNPPDIVIEKMAGIIINKGAKDNFSIGILDCIGVQYAKPTLTDLKHPDKKKKGQWYFWLIPLVIAFGGYYFWKGDTQEMIFPSDAQETEENRPLDFSVSHQLNQLLAVSNNNLNIIMHRNDSIVNGLLYEAPLADAKDTLESVQTSVPNDIPVQVQKTTLVKHHKSKSLEYDAIYYKIKKQWDETKASNPDTRAQSYMINLELLMFEIKKTKRENDFTNITKTNWQLEYLNNKFEMIKNNYYYE